jgi:hypothetical protein
MSSSHILCRSHDTFLRGLSLQFSLWTLFNMRGSRGSEKQAVIFRVVGPYVLQVATKVSVELIAVPSRRTVSRVAQSV